MTEPTLINERQLDLGASANFRVQTESPVGNQVEVRPGFLYAGAHVIADAFTGGTQTTAAFPPVAAAQQRFDLVFLDLAGAPQIQLGTQVSFGSPVFDGAPGFNLGPALPDSGIPLAYVFVDETAAVLVTAADITALGGQFQLTRDLDGHMVDKGLFGSAPSGLSDVVTALFAGETPGGGVSVAGVVTTAPLNYTRLLDQAGDEILHNTGARMYGRLTEAASVWTLAYHFIDAAGAEQTMDPSTDTSGTAPTDLRLVGVPKVFSRNDPNRPLFPSDVARLSDQVVGDIPLASPTQAGKVRSATGAPAIPVAGVLNIFQNNGSPVAGGPFHTFNYLRGGVTSPSAGVLDIPDPNVTEGKVIQRVVNDTSALINSAANIPLDDTIPLKTEGISVLTASITPISTTSKIRVRAFLQAAIANLGGGHIQGTLSKNGDTSVRAAATEGVGVDGSNFSIALEFEFDHPDLTAQTWELRSGANAGNVNVNGRVATRLFGGVSATTIELLEIED